MNKRGSVKTIYGFVFSEFPVNLFYLCRQIITLFMKYEAYHIITRIVRKSSGVPGFIYEYAEVLMTSIFRCKLMKFKGEFGDLNTVHDAVSSVFFILENVWL